MSQLFRLAWQGIHGVPHWGRVRWNGLTDELEKAAEIDETYERSFVLVIEATAAMLQGLEKAKAATQALAATGLAAKRV